MPSGPLKGLSAICWIPIEIGSSTNPGDGPERRKNRDRARGIGLFLRHQPADRVPGVGMPGDPINRHLHDTRALIAVFSLYRFDVMAGDQSQGASGCGDFVSAAIPRPAAARNSAGTIRKCHPAGTRPGRRLQQTTSLPQARSIACYAGITSHPELSPLAREIRRVA